MVSANRVSGMGFLCCLRSIELFDLCAAYISYLIINSGQYLAWRIKEDISWPGKSRILRPRRKAHVLIFFYSRYQEAGKSLIPAHGPPSPEDPHGSSPARMTRRCQTHTQHSHARKITIPRPAADTTGNLSPSGSDQDTAGLSAAGAASYRQSAIASGQSPLHWKGC